MKERKKSQTARSYVQHSLTFCLFFFSSYEYILINLSNKPDWFTSRFPTGKVPAIEQNGEKMVESEIICLFLDQMHPENSLFNVSGQEAIDTAKAWCSKVSDLLSSNFWNLVCDCVSVRQLNMQCIVIRLYLKKMKLHTRSTILLLSVAVQLKVKRITQDI